MNGRTPRRDVGVGEVWPEPGQVIPGRAEVVVDHVEDDPEPALVAGVDEPLSRLRATVGLVHREEGYPVVPPAVSAVEGGHWQQLDHVDAKSDQVVQPRDGGVQGALGGKGADVQLVDDAALQGYAAPSPVPPAIRRVVQHPTRAMDPMRLPGRAWVRQGWAVALPVVERVGVVGAGTGGGQVAAPPAVRAAEQLSPLAVDLHGDTLRLWCPHPEGRHGGTPTRPYRRGTPGSEGMPRRGYLP